MPDKTKFERVRDLLVIGEILTPSDTGNWERPLTDVTQQIDALREQGYTIDTVTRDDAATGYYMPDCVDRGALAAWCAKPLMGGAR